LCLVGMTYPYKIFVFKEKGEPTSVILKAYEHILVKKTSSWFPNFLFLVASFLLVVTSSSHFFNLSINVKGIDKYNFKLLKILY